MLRSVNSITTRLVTRFLTNADEIRLGDLGEWIGGGTPSKNNKSFWQGDIPWVSPKDLKAEDLVDSEDHISIEAVKNSSTRVAPEGSVLIAVRTGILRHTFPVVIARTNMAINQDLKALIPNTRSIPEFVAAFLRFKEASILRECVKSGTTVESVDFSLLKNQTIPLPHIDQQRTFLSELSKVNQVRDMLARNIHELQQVVRSVVRVAD